MDLPGRSTCDIDAKGRALNFSQGIMKRTSHLSKHPPNKKGKELSLWYILKIKTSSNCDVSKFKLRK